MRRWVSALLLLGALAAPAAAQRAVMEGVNTSRYTIKVDTTNGRVEIGTTSYTGGIPNVGLFIASNVVVGSLSNKNACVIYSSGVITCLGQNLVSSGVVVGVYVLKSGDSMSGALTVTGTSVTAAAFFGDGSHLTGIPSTGAISGTYVTLATFGTYGSTVTAYFTTETSSATFLAPVLMSGTSIQLTGSGGYVTGVSSITGSAFFGDGSHLTGIPSTGSISGTYVTLATFGTYGSTVTAYFKTETSSATFLAPVLMSGTSIQLTGSGGFVTGVSSITAAAFFGDGSHLTGIPSTGSIVGVYLPLAGGTLTGQLTIYNSSLTVTYGVSVGSLTATSSVTASAFFGDGSHLTGVLPSGTAGGSLTGTYPNPTLAASNSDVVTWQSSPTFKSASGVLAVSTVNTNASYQINGANAVQECGSNLYLGVSVGGGYCGTGSNQFMGRSIANSIATGATQNTAFGDGTLNLLSTGTVATVGGYGAAGAWKYGSNIAVFGGTAYNTATWGSDIAAFGFNACANLTGGESTVNCFGDNTLGVAGRSNVTYIAGSSVFIDNATSSMTVLGVVKTPALNSPTLVASSTTITGITTTGDHYEIGGTTVMAKPNSSVCAGPGACGTSMTGTENVVFGSQSPGNNLTSGAQNTFLGESAGNGIKTGSSNIFIGRQTGYYADNSSKLVIGNGNNVDAIVGDLAAAKYGVNITTSSNPAATWEVGGTFKSDSSATFNSAVTALSSVTVNGAIGSGDHYEIRGATVIATPSSNLCVGPSACGSVTGTENTVVGPQSTAVGLTSGSQNTFLGENAGQGITSGQNNIMIGRSSGYYANNSNKIIISQGGATAPFYGDMNSNVYGVSVATGSNPTATLEVGGTLAIDGTSIALTAGSTMTTNGGSLTISTVATAGGNNPPNIQMTNRGMVRINGGGSVVESAPSMIVSAANLANTPIGIVFSTNATNGNRPVSQYLTWGNSPTAPSFNIGNFNVGALAGPVFNIDLGSGTWESPQSIGSDRALNSGSLATVQVRLSTGTSMVAVAALKVKFDDNANINGVGSAGKIVFPTQIALAVMRPNALSLADSLSINTSGYVGLGIGPGAGLDINNYTASGAFPPTTGTSGTAPLRIHANADNGILDFGVVSGSGGAWLQSTNYGGLNNNYPLFLNPNGGKVSVATTTTSTALTVYGVITSSTTQGTISCSAGTGVLTAACNDHACTYAAGTAATNCTYSFFANYPKTPVCICGTDAAVPIAVSATATTGSVKCTAAAAMTGDNVSFICEGAP